MKKLFYSIIFCLFFNAAFATNYYWVNGTGNLSDYAHHWATTSGGNIFHTQLPSANDSVFFDANSFPSVNDSVIFDVANFVCRNMDWTGSANKTPIIITQNNQHKTFEIHGSLIFTSNLLAIGTLNDTIDIHFCSNRSGNVIYTAGNGGNFQFDSTGVDTLKDICNISNLNLINGTLVVLNSDTIFNQAMNLWNFTMGNQSAPASTVPKFYCSSPYVRFQNFYNYATNYILKADSTSFTIGGFMDCRSGNHFKFVGASSISSAHNKFDQLLLWVAGSAGVSGSASHYISNSNYDTIQTLTVESPNSNYNIDTLISTGDYIKNINLTGGSSNLSVFHFIPHQTFIDSIYWSTPAGKLIIEANDTLQIKKTFFNNYATIQSSIAGVQCHVNLKTPSCWAGSTNNDIDFCGTGVAVLDTIFGLVQTNISGNFMYGNCGDLVWSGETNRDRVVNNLDILNIGIANGSTGIARTNPTLNFVPQVCNDWQQQFPNMGTGLYYNYKFADCDGNGIVNANDTLAVSLNYSQTRPFRLKKPAKSTGSQLAIQLPTSILPNTIYTAPIIIGDVNNPLSVIYGAAFSIQYDGNQIDANSVSIDFSSSWIKSGNQFLPFQKNLPAENTIDATIVRTNQTDTSGFGVIGILTFKTKSTASGNLIFDFNANKTEVIDHQLNPLAIGWMADTATVVGSSGVSNINTANNLSALIYPNPATKNINLLFNQPFQQELDLVILDVVGKEVLNVAVNHSPQNINIEKLNAGFYTYCIKNKTQNNVVAKGKLVVN